MNRTLILILTFFFTILTTTFNVCAETELARPLPKQIEFADWEVGAFLCLDLNQWIDNEHHDGQEPASKFNPTNLDAEQWVLTAKAMGARYAMLTARHEGGFCLWPTKTHDYSVAASPWKSCSAVEITAWERRRRSRYSSGSATKPQAPIESPSSRRAA